MEKPIESDTTPNEPTVSGLLERGVSKPFRVVHKKTGKELWADREIASGFVHKAPRYPQVEFLGPEGYVLSKPYWERAC